MLGIQQGKAYCQSEHFLPLAEEAVSVLRQQIGRMEQE